LRIKEFLMLKRKRILIWTFLSLIVLFCIIALPLLNSISKHLSTTNRVKANILLIEGWLPPGAIEMAYDEFKKNSYDHVITTGIKISDYYQVSMNGYLIFYTYDRLKAIDDNEIHCIEIDAYSELEDKDCAHFNVFVNDSIVTGILANKKKRHYEIVWKGNLAMVDSVVIQFDNDKSDQYGDRNLYVKEIIFDHKTHIPYQYNSEYDIGELDGKRRLKNNFSSHAELARNKLLSLGLDSSLVLAIPGERVRLNRTLSSALAFRDWLKTSNIEVEGINVVTMGAHARRTLMTYNKILNKSFKIGIISLPDYRENASRKYKIFKTVRESIGLLYYWLILIPY
jgi:hypothetical protein